jgi:pimeloyl-ACP methyl ester carboxylesterase
MELVEVAPGIRVAVRISGAGAPGFLLVHGLASNARMWDGVAAHLAAAGHHVVAVDQRGHGASDKPDDGYDFATVASDLVAVIKATQLGQPVAVGQSWGADVVLELAARHPDAVSAVACIDGGVNDLRDAFPTWAACTAALTPPALAGTPIADFERELRSVHPDWPDSGIEGFLASFELRPDGTIAPRLTLRRHLAILRELWARSPRDRHALVDVPVLLVPARGRSEEQTWKERGVADAEARLRDVRVRWVEGDHDLHAQHPATVAALVLELAAR